MATKKRVAKTNAVGLTLYYDDNVFTAKLAKRVPGARYRAAAGLVEAAFDAVFGGYTHVSGSTMWTKKGADPDLADEVNRRLSMHDETLSITYDRPKTVSVPSPATSKTKRATKGDQLAISILKQALVGDGINLGIEGEIADAKKSINNTMKRLQDDRNALAGLEAKRDKLKETIERLGG